jgi:hypothetical protein
MVSNSKSEVINAISSLYFVAAMQLHECKQTARVTAESFVQVMCYMSLVTAIFPYPDENLTCTL